jgi:hypothetical protein
MATLCGLAGSDAEKAVIHRNITSDSQSLHSRH